MNNFKLEHVIEIYDFPASFENKDFMEAFSSFLQCGFDIKWVDSSHVLGIFSSTTKARDALRNKNPVLKMRPLAQSTRASQAKARKYAEFLQPVRPRPQTSALAAKRFVMQALGLHCTQSKHEYIAELGRLKGKKERKCNVRPAGKACRHSHSPTYALSYRHLAENSVGMCNMEKDTEVKKI
ncbi:hypothetical protein XENTR_v10018275 [Xenopus tropicalis]|uniref:Coiled-coil domain-containing protein R3HCC1L-like n=1 Tax=Xenopus tropicalis TaxID=8364 RepID=A0A8J1JXM6_XENTR|nr:coiled-coil domain-containing protein R3HCC1L-like [Xenopus tropicalis]KAE8591003.1 hypothetical protein XENTR_v10018275 [Xenopus tropicalis]